jgi:hypothetical protein
VAACLLSHQRATSLHRYQGHYCRCASHDNSVASISQSHFGRLALYIPNVAMAVDPMSPIAPARIRVLLLPVGRIRRSRFLTYVELLQQQSLVRLGDISPDPRPDRSMPFHVHPSASANFGMQTYFLPWRFPMERFSMTFQHHFLPPLTCPCHRLSSFANPC